MFEITFETETIKHAACLLFQLVDCEVPHEIQNTPLLMFSFVAST